MKKNIVKQLRAAAENLPVIYENARVRELGADVIEEHKKQDKEAGRPYTPRLDSKGKPYNPKGYYLFSVQKPVNHLEKMKQIFQSTPGDHAKKERAIWDYQVSVAAVAKARQVEAQKKVMSC
jgi:hypothetical protein